MLGLVCIGTSCSYTNTKGEHKKKATQGMGHCLIYRAMVLCRRECSRYHRPSGTLLRPTVKFRGRDGGEEDLGKNKAQEILLKLRNLFPAETTL